MGVITQLDGQEAFGAIVALAREHFKAEVLKEDQLAEIVVSNDHVIFMYYDDTVLVGYIYVTVVRADKFIHVMQLVTESAHQRRGIASALLSHIEAWGIASGWENIGLEVRVSNEAAISLYKNLGYDEIGMRKNFYEFPREDAFVFNKAL